MRYDADHKARTRAAVLKQAAAVLRETGPSRISVPKIMAGAGLTHGGFYAHFASKDDLVAHAITRMFEDARELLRGKTEGRTAADGLRRYVGAYLSTRHRDDHAHGCPVAALAGEVPRLSAPARRRFAAGLETVVAALADRLRRAGRPRARAEALSILAEMSGALALARAATDERHSRRILREARGSVIRRLGLAPRA